MPDLFGVPKSYMQWGLTRHSLVQTRMIYQPHASYDNLHHLELALLRLYIALLVISEDFVYLFLKRIKLWIVQHTVATQPCHGSWYLYLQNKESSLQYVETMLYELQRI